jgi:hypothetical protein
MGVMVVETKKKRKKGSQKKIGLRKEGRAKLIIKYCSTCIH